MGWMGQGRVFSRPTLDLKIVVWVLLPSSIGLAFLAGGAPKRPKNCKNKYEVISSFKLADIYGYDSKESGLVGPR